MSVGTEPGVWLFRSHETLYDGIVADHGYGEFEATHHIPLHTGRLVLNNTTEFEEVSDSQIARMQLSVDERSVRATLDDIRQEHSGDKLSLRGIIMPTGRADEFLEQGVDSVTAAPAGYMMSLAQGEPFRAYELHEGEKTLRTELSDYRIAEYFIEVISMAIKKS